MSEPDEIRIHASLLEIRWRADAVRVTGEASVVVLALVTCQALSNVTVRWGPAWRRSVYVAAAAPGAPTQPTSPNTASATTRRRLAPAIACMVTLRRPVCASEVTDTVANCSIARWRSALA